MESLESLLNHEKILLLLGILLFVVLIVVSNNTISSGNLEFPHPVPPFPQDNHK
jgi:hypothetical protein